MRLLKKFKLPIITFTIIVLILVVIIYINIPSTLNAESSHYSIEDVDKKIDEDTENGDNDLEEIDYEKEYTVPDVTGLYIYEAQDMLEENYFIVDEISYQDSNQEVGVIISQSPAGEKVTEKSSSVNLVVSRGENEFKGNDELEYSNDLGDNNELEHNNKPEEENEHKEIDKIYEDGESDGDYEVNETDKNDEVKSKGTHRVIVDSFAIKGNADAQVKELQSLGFDAAIVPITTNKGEILHSVLSGSFSVKENAHEQLENLKKQGYNPSISITDIN